MRQLHHVLMLSALNANFEKRNVITADDLTAQLSDAGEPQVFEKKVENREIPSNIENWLNESKNYFMKDFTKSITAIFQKLPKDPV